MGKLIVIEGLDGSGKTTQSAMLAKYMRTAGKKVREISFPCYGEKSCSLVEMYLGGELSKDPDDINGYASSVFFAADRYISYVTDWKKDYLDPNTTVIATRYTTANAFHQLSKLPPDHWDEFLTWLYDTEFEKLGLPAPDKVIMLSMTPALSSGNVNRRCTETGQKKDIHELDGDYLMRCYRAADYAAKKGGWSVVQCAPHGSLLPVDEVFKLILDVLE